MIGFTNLRKQKIWVLWGKQRFAVQKCPFQPDGTPALANDSSTWHSYEECVSAYKEDGYEGIGFQIVDPWCVADLDWKDKKKFPHALPFDESTIPQYAKDLIRKSTSYAEFSPSGLGVHVLMRRPPDSKPFTIKNNEEGVEVYTTARYMTYTARQLSGTPEGFAYYDAALYSPYARKSKGKGKKDKTADDRIPIRTNSRFSDPGQWAGRNDHFTGIAGLLRAALKADADDVRFILALCNQKFYPDNPLSEEEMADTLLKSTENWEEGTLDLASVTNFPNPNAHLLAIADFLRSTLSFTDEELPPVLELCAKKFWPKHAFTETELHRIISSPESLSRRFCEIRSRRLSEVHAKPVSWLLKGYLPKGALVTLFASKGRGKTKVCDWLTVQVNGLGVRVIRFNFEDLHAETMKPALHCAGANPLLVELVDRLAWADGHPERIDFSQPEWVEALTRYVQSFSDVGLIVVEPINNYKGKAKCVSEDDMRPIYDALAAVAEKTGVCVLAINHTNRRKQTSDSLERSYGASGTQVARLNFLLEKNPDDPAERWLMDAGSNLPTGPTKIFRIVEQPPFDLDGQHLDKIAIAVFERDDASLRAEEATELVEGTKVRQSKGIAEFITEFLDEHGKTDSKSVVSSAQAHNREWTADNVKQVFSRRKLGVSIKEGFGKSNVTYWAPSTGVQEKLEIPKF